MGILDLIRGADVAAVATLEEAAPVAVASSSTGSTVIERSYLRAQTVAENIALSIPAVRRAQAVIAGTISTFTLTAWDGDDRLGEDDPRTSWLAQPDPRGTLQKILFRTIRDGLWHDRSVWRVLDRSLSGMPVKFERINPRRISTISPWYDDEEVSEWIIDDTTVTDPDRQLVVFDFAGLGGLRRYGFELLDLYGRLQTAAGRYASAPHPKAILKNTGADLTDDEIDALLASWEAARDTRSVGYLNDVVDYETYGWSARELQLTEAREHAALEVARLFGLPAKSVDAPTDDSMTYGNVVEYRRDVLEALRPWMTTITQTLSLDDRTRGVRGRYLPRGIAVEFDADAYTRDAPAERFQIGALAVSNGLMSADEFRAREPYTRGLGPAPEPPSSPTVPPATTANPEPSPSSAAPLPDGDGDAAPPDQETA